MIESGCTQCEILRAAHWKAKLAGNLGGHKLSEGTIQLVDADRRKHDWCRDLVTEDGC